MSLFDFRDFDPERYSQTYAIAANEDKPRKSGSHEGQKRPHHVLVLDTETRITADQSLTFGVFRIGELENDK